MKNIIITLCMLGMIGVTSGFYLSNSPNEDKSNKKADLTTTAVELVKAFKDNEIVANITYLKKVVQVSGIVKSIKTLNETQIITIETGDLISAVSCEMLKAIEFVEIGDEVDLKGECAGYLLDVVLSKCVIRE